MTLKYADDFFIHGDVDEVLEVFRTLKHDFRQQTGLEFSPHKSELYAPAVCNDGIAALAARCHVKVTNRGVPVLGVPIGDTNYTMSELEQKVVDYGEKVEKCVSMCTKQVALAIVQHTASAYQHVVAVLPPEETRQFAERIDSINAQALRDNVFDTPGSQIDDEEWGIIMPRVKMRLRDGGLGVLSLADRAPMAFAATQYQIVNAEDSKSMRVAKWWAGSPLQHKHHETVCGVAVAHMAPGQNNDAQAPRAIDEVRVRVSKMAMRQMMEPVNARYHREYTQKCNDEAAQALVATSQCGANDVLTVRPNREEATLNDWEMSFAVYQRFGMLDRLLSCPDGRSHCLACNAPGPTGAHFASCGHSRKQRHDEVVVTHLRALEAAGVNARVEVQMQHAQRKIDIFYVDPQPESAPTQRVMADVTIQQAYQPMSTQLPNTRLILNRASKEKIRKYTNDAAVWRASVQPLPYTTFGAVSKDAQQWIARVEQAAIAGAHYFPGLERRFKVVWRENISFAILRATAAAAKKGVHKHRAAVAMQ